MRFRRNKHGQDQGLDIGLRSDGRRLVLPYPVLPHILIAGLTGSGKSSIINALLYALSPLPNVAIIGVDLKRVELTPWRDRLTLLAFEGSSVDTLLSRLRAEIEWRERSLQSIGERRWRPEFGPWMVFVIDEFAELSVADLNRLIEATQAAKTIEGDRAINEMMKAARHSLGLRSGILESFARKCRALGVTMIVATQYPTSDVIDTQVRSQFELRFMCRVASKEQVKVCLGNGMEDQVDVKDLSPHQRGSFVVAGLETKPLIARASWIDDTTVAAQAVDTAHLRITPEDLFNHAPGPAPEIDGTATSVAGVADVVPLPDTNNGAEGEGVLWL